MTHLAPGQDFAGYRIEGVAGRGGMGVVYRATQTRLNRVVALKVIAPQVANDPSFRRRFERESHIAASIEHPNVIPVYDVGEHDGRWFIAMRYVDGTDLGALVRSAGRLSPREAASFIAQVAAALDAAHAIGLVHRDVKPANVLVAGTRASGHAYLTDFGLSRLLGSSQTEGLTGSGMFVGTLDYIAPEQLMGERVDARADVYALGCVLYELLTGTVPFPRDSNAAKMYAHTHLPPPRVSGALDGPSREVDAVIERAMAKRPADRYASAGDLARAAVAVAAGDSASVAERTVAMGEAAPGRDDAPTEARGTRGTPLATDAATVARPPADAWRRRWPRAAAVAAVTLAVAGGAIAVSSLQAPSAQGPSQEEYAEELDRICLDAQEDISRVREAVANASTPDALIRQLDRFKETIEGALDELEAVERPVGEAGETGEQFVATVKQNYRETVLPAIDETQDALRSNDEGRVRAVSERLQATTLGSESERLAEQLGADRCTED